MVIEIMKIWQNMGSSDNFILTQSAAGRGLHVLHTGDAQLRRIGGPLRRK